ncbi:MAG: sigma 54-interacting transcriptional regulator [Deltaproteobacteria bacterium]|nr:sigma 54-interacting transcriptional regulator [Deltaproteobacteria bacterium]
MKTDTIDIHRKNYNNSGFDKSNLYLWDALSDSFSPIIRRETVVGRSMNADIILSHPGISEIHCKILLFKDFLTVRDTNSRYGIFKNRKKLKEIKIETGDIFFIANRPCAVTQGSQRMISGGFISRNSKMREIHRKLVNFNNPDVPVLVLGESGTGKELVSEMVHNICNNQRGAFIPLNCGSIAPELVESELFGHIKGSFSGAARTRDGVIKQAQFGTLFLDEIAELKPQHQSSILRWLEKKSYRPVGSDIEQYSNCITVAATHRNLAEEIEKGNFRHDLYYRLSGFEIKIPPLRKRPEDILILLDYFNAPPVNDEIIRELLEYSWPGNIRELKNVVISAKTIGWGQSIRERLYNFKNSNESTMKTEKNNIENFSEIQRDAIIQTLGKFGGNIALSARILDMPRSTLVNKMKKLGIS